MFDYGELRLLVLAMLSEQPRHGYDLMREIEERTGGSYSPSPGVIYPTLQWLEDMGYARMSESAGRKSYLITTEGAAFIIANQSGLDALLARIGPGGASDRVGSRRGVPEQIRSSMEHLRTALRARIRRGTLNDDAAEAISAALNAAAAAIEKS